MSKVLISSSFTLFNLQGTVFVPAAPIGVACELLYVNTSFKICQELFSTLFKFFFDAGHAPGRSRSSHNCFIISRNLLFVKDFFHFLTNFQPRRYSFRYPSGQLAYNTPPTPICQALFTSFYHLFW